MQQYDIAIIGGGIIGVSAAMHLSQKTKGKRIIVLEKENELAFHQTGHNSGVIHSGIYYKPGSLRAKNCQTGRKAMVSFCKEHHIAHDICGKIIVSTKEEEVPYMKDIHERGLQNNTDDIRIIDSNEIKEIEPYCEGVAALWVGCSGIVSYREVTEKMAEIFRSKGGHIELGWEVKELLKEEENNIILGKNNSKIGAKKMIFCGGSEADRLAKKDRLNPGMHVVPFRGEYYELVNTKLINNLIYPVPHPKFPWLGVHYTRMIDGSIECGPNAVFAFKRNGYNKTDFKWADTYDALTYKGFWKFSLKHVGHGVKEQWRSLNKRAFYNNLKQLIPSLKMEDIEPGRSGVRALALAPEGKMIDDFKFVKSKNSIHVLNAPSPAATASLAIGDNISQMAIEEFGLNQN